MNSVSPMTPPRAFATNQQAPGAPMKKPPAYQHETDEPQMLEEVSALIMSCASELQQEMIVAFEISREEFIGDNYHEDQEYMATVVKNHNDIIAFLYSGAHRLEVLQTLQLLYTYTEEFSAHFCSVRHVFVLDDAAVVTTRELLNRVKDCLVDCDLLGPWSTYEKDAFPIPYDEDAFIPSF